MSEKMLAAGVNLLYICFGCRSSSGAGYRVLANKIVLCFNIDVKTRTVPKRTAGSCTKDRIKKQNKTSQTHN